MADANNITVNDANGVPHLFATVYDVSSNTHRSAVNLADPFTVTNRATISVFHSADNQQPGGNAFGLLTGGVAQLLNPVGNIDRQRETGTDNIPSAGIATGTAQLASPQLVTSVTSGAITGNTSSGNTQFVNCATSFTQRANIVQTFSNGTIVLVDGGNANQEYVYVTAANSTGIVGQFMKGHAAAVSITGFSYAQGRDSAGPDGQSPIGMPSGTVWLWNGAANTGIGGVEIERSAAGEADGASGNGTNIAAEYEWNAGGPANSSGKATGFQFDRARSVQGKANTKFTITTTTAAMPNITFTAAANTNLLQPGQKVTLSGNATSGPETVLISSTFVPGSGNSALLQSPVVNPGQTTAQWDIYNVLGPALAGFYPDGVGIEEEALYDPVSALYYIERSATQDNAAAPNVVLESEALFNAFSGVSFERARSVMGKFLTAGFNGSTPITITNPGAAGNTTLTFSADPSAALATSSGLSAPLKAGMPVLLWTAGSPPTNIEVVFVSASYVSGTAVPTTATQLAHAGATVAQWETFGPQGAALTGFTGFGMDIDEDAVFDPVSGLFYLERSATGDNAPPQNIVLEAPALLNASGNVDRMRNNLDSTANTVTWTAVGTTTVNSANQTNFNHRGMIIYFTPTANSAAAANTVAQITVNNIDPVSGKFFPVLVTANIGSLAGNTATFQVYPGINNTANTNVSLALSRTFSINVTFTAQGTNTSTGQLTYTLIM